MLTQYLQKGMICKKIVYYNHGFRMFSQITSAIFINYLDTYRSWRITHLTFCVSCLHNVLVQS